MGGLAAAALLTGQRRLPEGDAPLRRLGWMLLAQAILFGGLTLAVRFPICSGKPCNRRPRSLGNTLHPSGITAMGMPVTVKGQVTIPKPLRDHLGIAPGSEVDFILDAEGRVLLQRAAAEPPAAPSRFARARGFAAARNGMTTEDIMALTRSDEPPTG